MKASWMRAVVLGIALGALPAGCTSRAQKVVANVGPRAITVGDFEHAASKLDPNYFAGDPDSTVKRRLLDDMVNKELLAIEATSRHYEADSTVATQIAAITSNVVLQKLYDDEVTAKIKVADADLKQLFNLRKTELVTRHLLVVHKETADSLYALIQKGASFDSLARARSNDPGTREKGGLLPAWVAGDMVPSFEKAAYALQPGQTSPPVSSAFGWHLIRMDERRTRAENDTASFARVKPELNKIVTARKKDELLAALVDGARAKYQLQYEPRVIERINDIFVRARAKEDAENKDQDLEGKQRIGLAFNDPKMATAEESTLVLARMLGEPPYRFKDMLKSLKAMPAWMRPSPGDTARARDFLDGEMIKRMMEKEAAARKLADNPDVKRTLKNRAEEIFVTTLYTREIQGKTQATDEQARAYWKAHPEYFKQPATVDIYRISMPTKAQADSVFQVIKGGKTIEAVGHDIGESPLGTVGATGPQPVNDDPNDLFSIASKLEEDELCAAPVQSSEYWTVFKVIRKTPGGVKDFNTSRKDAQHYASTEASEAALKKLLADLRAKYPIVVHQDVLKQAKVARPAAMTMPMNGQAGGSK